MKVKLRRKPGGFPTNRDKIYFVKALRQMTDSSLSDALAVANCIAAGETVEIELDEARFGETFRVWDGSDCTEYRVGVSLLGMWVNVYDADGNPLFVVLPKKPTTSLPAPLEALVEESRNCKPDSRQMLGFDADKPVMWKRGRADTDCIGMRAARLAIALGPTRMVREFIEVAIMAAQADGLSEARATATIGAALIVRLRAGRPTSCVGSMVSPQQVLVEHAAQLIEAGNLS